MPCAVPSLCVSAHICPPTTMKITNFESFIYASSLFIKKLLVPCSDILRCLPHSSLYNVLCDLGENDPVADCYMVGAQ